MINEHNLFPQERPIIEKFKTDVFKLTKGILTKYGTTEDGKERLQKALHKYLMRQYINGNLKEKV